VPSVGGTRRAFGQKGCVSSSAVKVIIMHLGCCMVLSRSYKHVLAVRLLTDIHLVKCTRVRDASFV